MNSQHLLPCWIFLRAIINILICVLKNQINCKMKMLHEIHSNVYWALNQKPNLIVTIDTAPVCLSRLHMTNVYFSLYAEAVATSSGSGRSLIAETNQDHSIHTPHKHKYKHKHNASGVSTASYVPTTTLLDLLHKKWVNTLHLQHYIWTVSVFQPLVTRQQWMMNEVCSGCRNVEQQILATQKESPCDIALVTFCNKNPGFRLQNMTYIYVLFLKYDL